MEENASFKKAQGRVSIQLLLSNHRQTKREWRLLAGRANLEAAGVLTLTFGEFFICLQAVNVVEVIVGSGRVHF